MNPNQQRRARRARDRAAGTATVPMQHDGVSREYQAPASAVGFWERHGWTRTDQGASVRTKQAAKAEKGGGEQ